MYSRVEITKLLLSIPRINAHLKSRRGKTALYIVKGTREDEIMALVQGELLSFQLQIRALIIVILALLLSCSHRLSLLSVFNRTF
jgi:hypothetical protein